MWKDAHLSLEIKQAIYRIIQEALANVGRHSSAEQVAVAIEYLDRTVQLTISDDGIGFTPSSTTMGSGCIHARTGGIAGRGFQNRE